jgi:hypothetical protein
VIEVVGDSDPVTEAEGVSDSDGVGVSENVGVLVMDDERVGEDEIEDAAV